MSRGIGPGVAVRPKAILPSASPLGVRARSRSAPSPRVARSARAPRGRHLPRAAVRPWLRSARRLPVLSPIPRPDRRAYWRSIIQVAAPGARLLLMTTAFRGFGRPGDPVEIKRVTGGVEDGQDGAFAIERVTRGAVRSVSGSGPEPAALGARLLDGSPRHSPATLRGRESSGRRSRRSSVSLGRVQDPDGDR
jgi:hypothetical protein